MSRPSRAAAVITAAATTLLLAACHPSSGSASSPVPHPTAHPTAATTTPSPSRTASASPTSAGPVQADLTDYLLEGTPYVADSDGEWDGHYGFWTDASHAVACDIRIFSGDSGGVSCGITPGHEGQRTYAIPAGTPASCGFDPASSYLLDGTAISINYKIFGGATSSSNVGFAGCLGDSAPTALDVNRRVLPPGNILTVTQQGFESYTCSVAADVASCSDSSPGSSFVFGLSTATFHQG